MLWTQDSDRLKQHPETDVFFLFILIIIFMFITGYLLCITAVALSLLWRWLHNALMGLKKKVACDSGKGSPTSVLHLFSSSWSHLNLRGKSDDVILVVSISPPMTCPLCFSHPSGSFFNFHYKFLKTGLFKSMASFPNSIKASQAFSYQAP